MENETKLFLCNICQKTFNRKDNLRRHIIAHQSSICEKGKSQIKCVQCSTKFRTRRHLLIHYTNDHGGKLFCAF